MKVIKSLNKYIVVGGLLAMFGLTSCDDFLTVLPTAQITEEDFWQDKNDLDNVRSAAYKKLTESGLTSKILIWGELRSDNLSLNQMSNTSLLYLQQGVLQPTDGIFDWGGYYTGINYCNKVLEYGQRMVDQNTDPSFSMGDWRPIKAEMLTMRALYYFYLVRAFRNVPFVEQSISTDAEAMNSRIAATLGVHILDTLINQLEECKDYAAVNYGSTLNNKGRITRRSVRAVLADIYLWRGCMLKHSNAKGDSIADADNLAQNCFNKAIEHCDYVINDLLREYREDLQANPSPENEELMKLEYPLTQSSKIFSSDEVYSTLWGNKNSLYESIFELQFDGTNNINSTISNYLSYYSSGNLSTSNMVAGSVLYSACNNIEPDNGFGKFDIRLPETIRYTANTNTSAFPIVKNVATYVTFENLEDMTEGATYQFRSSDSQNANWPVYRLSDLMLIKAEAIARLAGTNKVAKPSDGTKPADPYQLEKGFDLVNTLFERNNPQLVASDVSGADPNKASTRLTANYYYDKTGEDLLKLVYRERQREFVGEGKRWFDLVRQAEFDGETSKVFADFIAVTNTVKNRLKSLYSMYNPIYSEELKVNGKEEGNGQLVQNPAWSRYSK
ncbi:MAG: RagB/SusD family nutrient uptake outer membrane protein [Alloprevotella sp.]